MPLGKKSARAVVGGVAMETAPSGGERQHGKKWATSELNRILKKGDKAAALQFVDHIRSQGLEAIHQYDMLARAVHADDVAWLRKVFAHAVLAGHGNAYACSSWLRTSQQWGGVLNLSTVLVLRCS